MPEISTTTTIEFEVFCDECGAGMCGNTESRISRSRGMPQLVITPCENCLQEKYREGFSDGEAEEAKRHD